MPAALESLPLSTRPRFGEERFELFRRPGVDRFVSLAAASLFSGEPREEAEVDVRRLERGGIALSKMPEERADGGFLGPSEGREPRQAAGGGDPRPEPDGGRLEVTFAAGDLAGEANVGVPREWQGVR